MSILSQITDPFENNIRLGITGLSRSGKTVFITSLIANLLERERMVSFQAEADGRIVAAQLDEQPDPTVARFEFETHLASLLAPEPEWPESTRSISEIRISFRVKRKGLGAMLGDMRTINLDIVDYPGEWLLDLGLMQKSYEEWSEQSIKRLRNPVVGGEEALVVRLEKFDASAKHSEPELKAICDEYQELMRARKAAGVNDLVPGRFLLPAELEGAPAITFAPLPKPESAKARSAYAIFEARFEAYKRKVVKPFFRDHFSRLNRQVVLVDVVGALEKGASALDTTEKAMADILAAFRPGTNGIFSFLSGTKIEKIAFVATKADLIHHTQHDKLVALTRALLKSAERRAQYSGAKTEAKAVAALRSTVEDTKMHNGKSLNIVRGTREDGQNVGFYFGDLPSDPEAFLIAKMDGHFEAPKLRPPLLTERTRKGLPNIRLDQLADFLLGDRLK